MKSLSHFARRVVAVLAVLAPGACRDSATPPDRSVIVPSAVASSLGPSLKEARDLESVHRRNPLDWVGREHNRLLRKYGSELAKPGVLTRRTCEYLIDLSSDTSGDARARALPADQRRVVAKAGLATSGMCGNLARQSPLAPVSLRAPAFVLNESDPLSPAAADLTNRVLLAVESAESRYSLAAALLPILDQAMLLDTIGRAVVEAAVSVSQNSYEYWESELPAMQNHFYQDYGSCLTQAYQAGYPQDDARELCLNGGFNMADFGELAPALKSFMFSTVSAGTIRMCGGLADHYRKLAKADGGGAITGAIAGARTGGWAGAFAGGLVGAIAASTLSFVKSTWEIFWCAM